MAEKTTIFLFLVLSTFISTALSTTLSLPPPPLSTLPSPSPSPLSTTTTPPPPLAPPPPPPPLNGDPDARLQQIYNILDALIGSGDFGNWVNILSAADLSMFPISATLFIPDDVALSLSLDNLSLLDPFLFPYHIVPQRLTFSDLLLFKTNTRIPTLLPKNSILITNSSLLNFSLDGSPLTRPDLLATDDIVVHGIGGVLDYTVYGQDKSAAAVATSASAAPAPHPRNVGSGGGSGGRGSTVPFWPMEEMHQASCGDCLASKFRLVSFVLVTSWFFKHYSRFL